MLSRIRAYLAHKVLLPLFKFVNPWPVESVISMTGYFWVVIVKLMPGPSEVPASFQVCAMQLNHDSLVQVWEFDQMDGGGLELFIDKLQRAMGVNNVVLLKNPVDVANFKAALDKTLNP